MTRGKREGTLDGVVYVRGLRNGVNVETQQEKVVKGRKSRVATEEWMGWMDEWMGEWVE